MGEPLHHKDIREMIRLAAGTGCRVELLTNGTLLTECMIRDILDAGLSRLWISLDDPQESGSTHSGHTHSGSVLDRIRSFNRIRTTENRQVSLGITFVAMKSNVHQLAQLPFFLNQYRIDEVNISNVSPTDEASRAQMLYPNLENLYTGPEQAAAPVVRVPFFDLSIPEVAAGLSGMMRKRYYTMYLNDQPVIRKKEYCKFVQEGMAFVRSDGNVSPCMALLHNSFTYLNDIRRTVYHRSFGNIREQPLSEIWNSEEYRAFRRKFDDFDFAPCTTCGHCDLVADNKMDCMGNENPACGACLWAEGVLSCP